MGLERGSSSCIILRERVQSPTEELLDGDRRSLDKSN